MLKLRFWLTQLLRCKHKLIEYEFAGGKACPHDTCSLLDCEGRANCNSCSLPVYEVYCCDCGMNWTLGEDELIGFFARQRQGN